MAKILIVEAESVDRRLAANALKRAGHDVIEASRGARGLKIAVTELPDLVLVDTLLPDMDGGQFVRTLWSNPEVRRPKVIFRAPTVIDAEARSLADSHTGFFMVKRADEEWLCAQVTAALSAPAQVAGIAPSAPAQASDLWRRLTRKLSSRTEKLERQLGELQLQFDKNCKQLDVARRAVDREIKKRRWAEQELSRLSLMLKDQTMLDLGTGLHNRRFLEESLAREESRALRNGEAFAVMIIDIEDLKQLNSRLGHAAGDAVLQSLGEHVQSLVRGEDIVARYGVDEFALLLPRCPEGVVWKRAEKLRDSAGQLAIEHNGKPLGAVSLSVGIGIFPRHGQSGREVLQAATLALKQARQAGKHCTVVGDAYGGATPAGDNSSRTATDNIVPPRDRETRAAGQGV